jgi:hypothetical protein
MSTPIKIDFEERDGNGILRAEIARPELVYGITFLAVEPEHPHADITAVLHPLTGDVLPVYPSVIAARSSTKAVACVPWHEQDSWDLAMLNDLPMKQVIVPHFGTPRENEEYRGGGCGIVIDTQSQKYAVYQTPEGVTGFFSGGVNKDENIVDGVLREIREESGLYDFADTEIIAEAVAHYHHAGKHLNRIADATLILVRLASAATQPHAREAHENFELAWQTPMEMLQNWKSHNKMDGREHWVWFLKRAAGRAIELGWDTESDPNLFWREPYLGEGTLIASRELTGVPSEGAEPAALELLSKIGVY